MAEGRAAEAASLDDFDPLKMSERNKKFAFAFANCAILAYILLAYEQVKKKNESPPTKPPGKVLPFKRDEEDWITESNEEPNSKLHDEKGKQKLEMSLQNSSKNSPSHILNKKWKKKSSHVDKANKECGVSCSSSYVVNIKDMNDTYCRGQQLTEEPHGSTSTCKAFIQFCSTEIICPEEYRAELANKLYGVQVALLSALSNPFDNMSQSISSRNSSRILLINLRQALTEFLPAIIWSGMFTVSFIYTVTVVWSLAFRVPIISMLCLALFYCLSVLVAAASGFHVICGTFKMNGILFASLGVLGFVLLLVSLVLLVLFASWRHTNQDGGAK